MRWAEISDKRTRTLREWKGTIEEEDFVMPMVWYHSTEADPVDVARDFASNNIDPTGAAPEGQFWFSDDWEASRYYGHNTVQAKLHFKNPLIVTKEMWERPEHKGGPTKWAKFAQNSGHDAVIIPDIMDGDMFSTVCCVFDPKLIEARPYAQYNEDKDDFDLL